MTAPINMPGARSKQSGLSAFKVVILNMPIMMLAMNITTLAVVWYGGNIIIAGDMAVGDLIGKGLLNSRIEPVQPLLHLTKSGKSRL